MNPAVIVVGQIIVIVLLAIMALLTVLIFVSLSYRYFVQEGLGRIKFICLCRKFNEFSKNRQES